MDSVLRFALRMLAAAAASLAVLAVAPSRAQPLPRVVTLLPSLSEDAFAVGAHVVGVSRFTGNIAASKGLPRIADFESVDVEDVVALHPDVVIGIPAQARFTAQLSRLGVRVVLIPDDTYDDIFRDLRAVGAASGRQAAADTLIAKLRRETAAALRHVPRRAERPSVFFALGTGPIWTVGPHSYLETLIRMAGGRNVGDALSSPWGQFSAEALLRAQPDAIITGPETHLQDVLGSEPWRSLRAVREGHVFVVTDRAIDNALYRPGPRYIEGLRWLIERLSSLSTATTHPAHSNRN